MSKRRRDEKHDSSSLGKVAKVGAAALSVGVGVAAFKHTNLSRKLTSEYIPALNKTSKQVSKELRDLKANRKGLDRRLQATDLKTIYDKHLKENRTFKSEVNRLRKDPLKIDTSNKSKNLPGHIKNIAQVVRNDAGQTAKEAFKAESQQRAVRELAFKYKDKNIEHVNDLANNAFKAIDENAFKMNNGELIFSSDFLKEKFNKAGFNKKETHDFLSYIYKEKEKINIEASLKGNYKDAYDSLAKKAKETILENPNTSNTKYAKFDKLLKDKFNINIDSEYLLTGSKAATWGDIKELRKSNSKLFNEDSFKFKIKNNFGGGKAYVELNLDDVIDDLEKELDTKLDNLIFDKNLRIKNGELFSNAEIANMAEKHLDNFSSSTLGRIFGLTDTKLTKQTPMLAHFKALSTGKEAAWDGENASTIIQQTKVAVSNPITKQAELFNVSINPDGKLVLDESAIAKGHLRDNSHGKSARLSKEMTGTNRMIIERNESFLAKLLDIKQDGSPTLKTKIKTILNIGDNDEWAKNSLKRTKKLFTSDASMIDKIDDLAYEYMTKNNLNFEDFAEARTTVMANIMQDQKKLSNMLNDMTAYKQIDNQTIASLLNSGLIEDKGSLRILEILNNKDYSNAVELLEQISTDEHGNIVKLFNKDLENILNRGFVNSDYTANMQNISQAKSTAIANLLGIESTNVLGLEDIVRREAVKEILVREAGEYSINPLNDTFVPTEKGITKLERILQNSNLDNIQEKNLRNVANWGVLQSTLKLYNDTDSAIDLEKMTGDNGLLTRFNNAISSDGHFRNRFVEMIDDLSHRQTIFDTSAVGNLNENFVNEYNNFAFMKNSAVKELMLGNITSINEFIKQAGKELIAGRHDMENYTTLTQIPQFMVSRLAWGVDGIIGLGFSSDNTGSTLDLIKNIAIKRVAPVMGAFALYDYMNYESENFTGVSITGAAANAIANLDLGARKLAYSIGIGQALDWVKDSSVLGEYWTGTTDFQNVEERQDWYENGYSAVRGGRFWGFGSTSEFRGSAIQYYQPNYLKRAHSNWQEIGVYGSAEEKFKHSWLPSLRHPLSPIRALMDPYWLEKKNMDERPYPLTGKLFSEGTPWGAILNPTIGEMIKPVRMLPEIKKRLGRDGRDIRTVLEGINSKIKNRGNENDDMLIVNGTDIRTAKYVPYANTGDGYMNIQFNNGQAFTPGIGYMNDISNIRNFTVANGQVSGTTSIPTIDANEELIQEIGSVSYDTQAAVNGIVEGINNTIKKLATRFTSYSDTNTAYNATNLLDRNNSTYVYTNLVNQRNQFNSNYYSSSNAKMVNKNLAQDYLADGMYSLGQLSGIYGFLNDFAFGNDGYSFRYENAGQMASFSRHFWDAQVGGIGGDLMEIARRFFPSEDKSRVNYNPLRNSMPDWLPERFLTGDPYTTLPKGEMRMPGKGYESIHDLHPDQFGEYGAFDRMKILGDIAPTSEEYKIWRNIARNTVTDNNLIKQMEEIEERAQKMSSKHEFYDYRYVNNNVEQKEGVIKSWDGNIVTLVSGEQLRLGGINLNEQADLSQFIQTGQKIHYRTSADAIKRLEDGIVTNAVIYKKDGSFGVNINNELVKLGMAERDKTDKTAIGYLANASTTQQTLGAIQEVIGHAQIPFIHNKYMKIETARESFRQEHVYGTSFATWDNPIQGFIQPAFNQTFGQSFGRHLLAVGSSALYFNMKHLTDNSLARYASGALMAGLNPTALLGMGVEFISNLGLKAIGNGSNLLNIERGAAVGSVLGTVGWGLANAENPFKAATSFAIAGEAVSKYLNIDGLAKQMGKSFDTGRGALLGAGIGLAISAIKNPHFSKDMFRKEWIPEKTEKKYELDEYFDRLEYIKYKGLYEQAVTRAFLFEGNINIKRIFKQIDKNKEKIAELTRKAEKLSNKYSAGGYEYEQKMSELNNKIQALQNRQTVFKGGKYTKAAVSYKKAMESTIYGLSEGATSDEILASIPVQYKDHFVAFINERSEKERKKILKQLPEYLHKPLQIAWGEKPDKVDSNRKFFKTHAMPGMAWRGWKPNINMKHVKMRTIQNEGMLLSDFGYYESEKSKIEYHMAPDITDFDKGQGAISYLSNMTAAMSGLGMSVQNISVEPTSSPGLWIAADVKQTASDIGKVSGYAVNSGIQTLTSLLF